MPVQAQATTAVAVATITRTAPDHAADPHGEPIVTEMTLPEPTPQLDAAPTAEAPRASPVSGVSASTALSFRVRTAKFARVAVSAAQQRRRLIAALLGVALLSASIGVLAGRWLAARAESPAATR